MADERQEAAGDRKRRTLAEMIADEPDVLRRCALIDFGMDYMRSPEDALLLHRAPNSVYNTWAQAHYNALVSRTAQATGGDPAQIADKDKRTPAQLAALAEAAAKEQIARLEAVLNTNFIAAVKHINEYCIGTADAEPEGEAGTYKSIREGQELDDAQPGQLLNVPYAAALYFFATHPDVKPQSPASLTANDKAEIIDCFADLDDFYTANRATLQTEKALLQEYINAANADNPIQAAETLGRLNDIAVRPTHLVIPNHKLVHSLPRATRNTKDMAEDATLEIILDVSKHGAKKKVTSTCILSYDVEKVRIRGRKPFTEFHRGVYNAVTSLYVAGNRYITPAMIWRTMTGKTQKTEMPSHEQEMAIIEAVDDMRMMLAKIDAGEEFKMQHAKLNGEDITGGFYDDNLLHMRLRGISTAHGEAKAYEILATPVLYEYSADMGQLITVPLALLDVKVLDAQGAPTGRSAQYTERRSTIYSYLLRRIEGMKGRNRLASHCIAYKDYDKDGRTHDGLYTIAGNPELSKPLPEGATDADKARRKNTMRYIRADAKLALDYWTATGYIAGYHEYKEGGTNAGIEIDLPQRKIRQPRAQKR